MDRDALLAALHAAPDDLLDVYPVSTAVNRAANDGPALVEPVTPEPEPAEARSPEPARKRKRAAQPEAWLP